MMVSTSVMTSSMVMAMSTSVTSTSVIVSIQRIHWDLIVVIGVGWIDVIRLYFLELARFFCRNNRVSCRLNGKARSLVRILLVLVDHVDGHSGHNNKGQHGHDSNRISHLLESIKIVYTPKGVNQYIQLIHSLGNQPLPRLGICLQSWNRT